MKDYYKILGVRSTAHDVDIKRAFRQLAIRYHPDKNSDPSAELLFKEINEAYEVLSDPQKRAGYDWRRQNPLSDFVQEPTQPQHRDPAYRRPKPNGPRRKGEREYLFEMMEKCLPLIHKISIGCFALSMLLLIDYVVPNQKHDEKIMETSTRTTYSRNYSTTWWVIKTESGIRVELPFEVSDYFQVDHRVAVYSSLILNINRKVVGSRQVVPIHRSLYGNFIFLPTALLIISSLALKFKENVERAFNFGIIGFLILIFTGVIFLML